MAKDNKRSEVTKNSIFRKFRCGLTIEQTAELCFKSVREVSEWDKGKPIPPICKRLMRMYSHRELDPLSEDWEGWRLSQDKLITPAGWGLTPNRILAGDALIHIGDHNDRKALSTIVSTARLLQKMP